MKKDVLRNFARPGLATLLKKRLWHRCFPVDFAKFLRTPFLQNTSGQLLLYVSILAELVPLLIFVGVLFITLIDFKILQSPWVV